MSPKCEQCPRYRPPFWRVLRSGPLLVPVRVLSLLLRHFLLAGDGTPRTLLGPCIGMGALAPDRQTPPVSNTAVAPDVHQALDIHGDFGAKRAFDLDRALDHLAKPGHLIIRQIANPGVRIDAGFAEDAAAGGTADTKDVGQRDLNP